MDAAYTGGPQKSNYRDNNKSHYILWWNRQPIFFNFFYVNQKCYTDTIILSLGCKCGGAENAGVENAGV